MTYWSFATQTSSINWIYKCLVFCDRRGLGGCEEKRNIYIKCDWALFFNNNWKITFKIHQHVKRLFQFQYKKPHIITSDLNVWYAIRRRYVTELELRNLWCDYKKCQLDTSIINKSLVNRPCVFFNHCIAKLLFKYRLNCRGRNENLSSGHMLTACYSVMTGDLDLD